ncbi:Copper chaperone SCO1/SenC [Corchorus olitorius]|uniref:Copper chaperone SCO1/SenC n=1 Tax=Corchorus olitorius TaxID=93759 RepID=A0A1R3KAJ3_9ROSI|nr:Copper chaperone SCO1/SenC [Corchorus olitorius]
MALARLIASSSKQRFTQTANLLQRFGPSKRIQSCGYAKSAKNGYGKPKTGHPVVNVEQQASASRSWGAYVVPAALLGFGGFITLLHLNDQRRKIPLGQGSASVITTAGPVIGGPFTLVNTENQVVTEKDFLGNWVLLYFGYTSSPDVGPDQVRMMAKATETLELKENVKVLPVFVTIDPQRDTPAHLRAYLKEFDPRIVGLTGPVNSVRQMALEYRVFFRKVQEEGDDYLVESSHNMYLIDPKMKVVRCFGLEYTAGELSKEILKEVKKTPNLKPQ